MANVQAAPVMGPMANPALMQDPDYVMQMMQSQRRQQLAQALTQQGMAPIDYDPRGAISKWQGVSKLASALMGGYEGNKAMQQQAALTSQGMQTQLQQLGAGQPQMQQQPQQPQPAQPSPSTQALAQGASQGSVGPTMANAQRMQQIQGQQSQPPQQPQQQPQMPQLPGTVQPTAQNPYGLPPMLLIRAQQGDPAAMEEIKTMLAGQQLTPEQRNSRDPLIGSSVQGNLQTQNMEPLQKLQLAMSQVPPGSPQAQQIQAAIAKANYVAPAEIKQGNVALNANNQPIFYNPKTADGIAPMFSTQNGMTAPTGARALPGYAGANAAIAGAEQGAKQANTVFTGVPGADNQPVSGYGRDIFGGGAAPGAQRGAQPQPGIPGQPPAPQGAPGTPQMPPNRPGVVVGANPNLQTDMGKRWSDLYAQVGQSQNVISYLQQIKQLAPAAATGQFSDRQQLVNSLLSQAGSERATDAVSAKNLLDKYSNQIIARLGQGGLGTDAAREIVASAYPNSHMTPQAIQEAADNAIGAQQAIQSKAQLLQRHYLSANPQGYQQTETAFDQAADPRIFQWKNMQPGPARDAFGKALLQSDPSIATKMQTLQGLGVQ